MLSLQAARVTPIMQSPSQDALATFRSEVARRLCGAAFQAILPDSRTREIPDSRTGVGWDYR